MELIWGKSAYVLAVHMSCASAVDDDDGRTRIATNKLSMIKMVKFTLCFNSGIHSKPRFNVYNGVSMINGYGR